MILEAASEVFARSGYDLASMREVAQESGVTTPVLYDHFRSKIDLYNAAIDKQAEQLISSWAFPSNTSTPEELFNETTGAFFRSMQNSWIAWRILFVNKPFGSDAAASFERAQSYATEAVAACIRALGPLNLPVDLEYNRTVYALAESIKASGHALVAWWYENEDVPIEDVIKLNKTVVWGGVENLLTTNEER